jgi:hypothetical protein
MELTIASNPEFKTSAESGYTVTIIEVDNCIESLYEELKLPK